MKVILMAFTNIILFGEMSHFGSRNSTSHNSVSTLRICLRFGTVKGANWYMESILMAFPKHFLFGVCGPFRTQNGASSQLWIRGQERHEDYISSLSEKNLVHGNLAILAQKWYVFIILDLLSGWFCFILILHNKILLVFFFLEDKSHLGQFDIFRPFFTVCLGHVWNRGLQN